MLTLANFGNDAVLQASALKTTQCAVQRLVGLYFDVRHFLPSLRVVPNTYGVLP